MTDASHQELLQALSGLAGMVVLSGYASDLYSDALAGWEAHSTQARISSGRGAGVRTETVWINPHCRAALASAAGGLFAEAA